MDFTRENEITSIRDYRYNFFTQKPHVFVLGAGASKAACPQGDALGKPLPLMNDLVNCLNLRSLIENEIDLSSINNFELIYSEIHKTNPNLIKELENIIRQYFSQLKLPEYPTIYDYLVVGLRSKDVIATFNWDPFLFQALQRNWYLQKQRYGWASLPEALYLHGNVAVGYCLHSKSIGPIGSLGSFSQKEYVPSKLLYPIEKKNYTEDPFIVGMWKELGRAFNNAFMLTIFGYGTPDTDFEAKKAFETAWGSSSIREFEEIEIINIEPEEKCRKKWKSLIHTHHYRYTMSFLKSQVTYHPRRSLEALFANIMEVKNVEGNPFPECQNMNELYKFLDPLFESEAQCK